MEKDANLTPETPSPVRYELPGSFKNQSVQVERLAVLGSHRVFVNLHGTYGIMHGNSGKYGELARRVADEKLANAVVYSTSRDWEMSEKSDGSYEARMESFRGKTFNDELADARTVIADLVTNSQRDFGVPADKLEITLHGNSLGGIIAFYLASEFPQVKAIATVGTGLRLATTDAPILSTFPAAEEVRAKLAAFKGKYLMQYGTEDDVFGQDAFQDLYSSVTGAEEKSSICYAGVDHPFKSVDGEKAPEVFAKVIEQATEYLKTGRFASGMLFFDPPSEMEAIVEKYEKLTAALVASTGNPAARVSGEDENPLWE